MSLCEARVVFLQPRRVALLQFNDTPTLLKTV